MAPIFLVKNICSRRLMCVTGPPFDTLYMTTRSHHIPPTPYNPTLAEYGRTLRGAVDGILPYIAAHCPHIAVVGRRRVLAPLYVPYMARYLLTQQPSNDIYPFPPCFLPFFPYATS